MLNYSINLRGIASEHFQDETIILNLPKGNYYSLRGVAQLIWTQLEQELSTDQIVQVILDHYDTSSTTVIPTLDAFLNQLAQEDLIQEAPDNQSKSTPQLVPDSSRLPFIAPVLEVYTDMQELLMLDPIHDADPEKGWPYKNK